MNKNDKNHIKYEQYGVPEQVSLVFSGAKAEFCRNYTSHVIMEAEHGNKQQETEQAATLDGQYEALSALLLDEKLYMDGTLGFREVCSWIGADPERLGALIREELGLSGEDLLRTLREGERESLRRKYAPKAQK